MTTRRKPTITVVVLAALALLLAACPGTPGATPLPPVVPALAPAAPSATPEPSPKPVPTVSPTSIPAPTTPPVEDEVSPGADALTPEPRPEPPPAMPEATAEEPAAAPGLIIFSQGAPEGVELFAAPASGTDPVQLTASPRIETGTVWSPDGSRIAYVAYDPTNDGVDLWVLDPAAPGSARPVTTHGMVAFDTYSWAPDGQSILYSAPQANGAEMDVYRLEIDSGEVMTLTADWWGWDSSPAWSPDGTQIAFVSDRGEDGKFWTTSG